MLFLISYLAVCYPNRVESYDPISRWLHYGQTGDVGKKPETEDGDVQKFQKVEKMEVSENRK